MIKPHIEKFDLVEIARRITKPKEIKQEQIPEKHPREEPAEIKVEAQITRSDYIKHPQYNLLVPKFE